MSKLLIEIISEQTETFLKNVDTTIQTCDYEYTLNNLPNWKQVYHALHSLDKWFINPEMYDEPEFHVPGLNSLFMQNEKTLSKQVLIEYFESIKSKIRIYLKSLTDEMLSEKPEGCKYTRMTLILGQYRHLYSHLGIINCTTVINTGKWPRIVGLDGDFSKGLYE